MSEMLEKTDELKTVSLEKNTWILEVPVEVCRCEGFAEGTLISLTFKDNVILTSYIHLLQRQENQPKGFIGKYSEFMKEMEEIDG